MRRWLALLSMLLAVLAAAPPTEGGVRHPAHTKKQAEVNVLSLVAKRWKTWRRSGVVNPRTHLLADNTEAVCSGRGKSSDQRYERFLCVVRPHVHRGRQGLWLSYRALSKNRFRVTAVVFRKQ
jgi:hypothetical protein